MNNPAIEDEMDLDSLYAEARAAARLERRTAAKSRPVAPPPEPKPDPGALYTRPENWVLSGYVTLIHSETQTVLGNFAQWTHRTVPDTRKLIRAEEIVEISQVEYVSGQWGYISPVAPGAHSPGLRRVERSLLVQLIAPRVHAITEVAAVLDGPGVIRVELTGTTSFANAEGELLVLPTGTNVLQVMSFESKVELRKLLGDVL